MVSGAFPEAGVRSVRPRGLEAASARGCEGKPWGCGCARGLPLVPSLFRCLAGKEAQGQLRLFDDLPPAGSADTGKGSSLLFDDLPPASSSDAASSAPEQVSEGSHAKGEKRKSMEEEEKNGREELVEKKVCKGFQTV